MSKKKNDGFNTPFANLKAQLKKDGAEKKRAAPAQPQYTAPQQRSSSSAKSGGKVNPTEEERAFLDAMAGVAPISRRHPLPVNVPEINARIVSEEAEALAQLYDLVSGRGDFQVSATDAFIEGSAPGVDDRLLKALKRGDYVFQAHVDVRGLKAEEAKNAVDLFFSQSKREGKRCVLIIHGTAEQPMNEVRDQVAVWLERGRMGKLSLAFCTARKQDGGTGAMYVLLRR